MQFSPAWSPYPAHADAGTADSMFTQQVFARPMPEYPVRPTQPQEKSQLTNHMWRNSSHPDVPVDGQRFVFAPPPLWQREDDHGSGLTAGIPRWQPSYAPFVRPDPCPPGLGAWATSQGFQASHTPYARSFSGTVPQRYWAIQHHYVGGGPRGPTHGGSPYFPMFPHAYADVPPIPTISARAVEGTVHPWPLYSPHDGKETREDAAQRRLPEKRPCETEEASPSIEADKEVPRTFKRDRRGTEGAHGVASQPSQKVNAMCMASPGLHDAAALGGSLGRFGMPSARLSDPEDYDLPCLPGIRVSGNTAHDKIYRCGMVECDGTFTSMTNAAAHLQSAHDVPRPFLCRVDGCHANFASKAVLSMHARVHSGEKPFKCTHKGCNASFGQKSNLKRHALVHTGARPVRTLKRLRLVIQACEGC
jgi:hypothetical protein